MPIKLTSDWFDQFLPGMVDRYGHNETVELHFATYLPPEAIIENGQIGGLVQFDIHVRCKNEDAIVARVINGKAEASIDFANFNLTVQITAF